MDFQDLRVFCAVADAGSLTGASARLHLALAAVSARLQRLEGELGQPLFLREARGVRLTPAGELALAYARDLLERAEALREAMAGGGEVRGRVRLWASTMAVAEHLPPLLGALLARWPLLELQVEERPSAEVLLALDSGRADIGVISGLRPPRSWLQQPFRRDRLVVVLPAQHPLAERAALRWEELLEQPFIAMEEGTGIQRFLEGHAARLGRSLHIVVRVRAMDSAMRMVAAGAGLAVLPASTALRLAAGAQALRPLEEAWAERELQLCMRPGLQAAAVRAAWGALCASVIGDGSPPRDS
jgi:DNA-binding transcriptional LysR family regulator